VSDLPRSTMQSRPVCRRKVGWAQAEYTWESNWWDYFTPQRGGTRPPMVSWSPQNEIAVEENYRLGWLHQRDKEPGAASARAVIRRFIYQTLGVGYIRELELFRRPASIRSKSSARPKSQGAACAAAGRAGHVEVGQVRRLSGARPNPSDEFKCSRDGRDAPRRVAPTASSGIAAQYSHGRRGFFEQRPEMLRGTSATSWQGSGRKRHRQGGREGTGPGERVGPRCETAGAAGYSCPDREFVARETFGSNKTQMVCILSTLRRRCR